MLLHAYTRNNYEHPSSKVCFLLKGTIGLTVVLFAKQSTPIEHLFFKGSLLSKVSPVQPWMPYKKYQMITLSGDPLTTLVRLRVYTLDWTGPWTGPWTGLWTAYMD